MAEFDVNNVYGVRALMTLYADTSKITSAAPDLLAIYESMRFLGDLAPATGRWADWEAFAKEVRAVWRRIRMYEDMEFMKTEEVQPGSTKESSVLNRFFNRLLMLDIDLQNAVFEVFFAIYSELVRIDKSNGEFDEGVENLNDWHGRRINRVEIEKSETLYTDPRSGAETCYHVVSLDRGTCWEDAKDMFDKLQPYTQEGFYCYRAKPSDPPEYFLAKERQQVGGAGSEASTWQARRRKKQYVVWKPDFHEGSRQIALESHLTASGCERLEGPEDLKVAEDGWNKRYKESQNERLIKIHVLTGDVLTVWRLAKKGDKADKAAASGEGGDGEHESQEPQEQEQKEPQEQEPKEPQEQKHALQIDAMEKELQIVRAITQPQGLPIVGLKISEADLPKLRYVLSCQQVAMQEASSDLTKKSLRDVTMEVALELTKRVREAPERKLPYTTWFEVHKALAADNLVACSATALRGTQMAVDRLKERRS